ncbi:MAG: glycosyltransferase family 4 protein [Gammaproteobacteria bacterium]|nr:glycosyltransferase family 4 protein [Gammaproteobacteria bacterium]
MNSLLFFVIVIFLSFLLTELIRRYSLKMNIIDMPNERSSHLNATPRGGGLSIVIVFLIGVGVNSILPFNISMAIIGAGFLVACIGFWDDKNDISAKWRLLTHFIAAIWVVYWLGTTPEFHMFGIYIASDWVMAFIVIFMLVWLLNLFNFMDGIDGIAASETIFVACGGAYFLYEAGLENLSSTLLLLAASTMGFLILNWSPAKIFLGDVGSGFLGLMLGTIAYTYILEGGSVWVWFILLGVFLVDSSVTLLRRIYNKERWYEAHCSHAYQHIARKWGHKRTTISVIFINLFWLLPLAIVSQKYPELGFWSMLLALIPIIFVALKFNAGITNN